MKNFSGARFDMNKWDQQVNTLLCAQLVNFNFKQAKKIKMMPKVLMCNAFSSIETNPPYIMATIGNKLIFVFLSKRYTINIILYFLSNFKMFLKFNFYE